MINFPFVRQSNYTGLTGAVEFDTKGLRSNLEIEIVYLNEKGLPKAGSFKPPNLNFLPVKEERVNDENLPISEQTFIVKIAINHPYNMYVEDTTVNLSGNDRYEGFCIDIIKELANIYKFKYVFELGDTNYGKKEADGSWRYVRVVENNRL